LTRDADGTLRGWRTAPNNAQGFLNALQIIGESVISFLPSLLSAVAMFDPTGITTGVLVGITVLNQLTTNLWAKSGTVGFKQHDMSLEDDIGCLKLTFNLDENVGQRYHSQSYFSGDSLARSAPRSETYTNVEEIPVAEVKELLNEMRGTSKAETAEAVAAVFKKISGAVDTAVKFANPVVSTIKSGASSVARIVGGSKPLNINDASQVASFTVDQIKTHFPVPGKEIIDGVKLLAELKLSGAE